ncbi:MAG: bifunctional folylpolyglutamate synthase/dihydrofolate synthase [Patescibacteria group bacterium]
MIKTYKQAEKYLEKFIPFIVNHKINESSKDANYLLERMRYLLNLLDNPQKKFPSVIVSGTSGKGSTSYLIAQMLATAGYRTGLTISPHLQKATERIQINQQSSKLSPISDDDFLDLLNLVAPVIKNMEKSMYGPPSYFELLMALALETFALRKVDIAVVEVGIEGKYDATNIIDPLIFTLTNISLDHTAILGETEEEIADEATFRLNYIDQNTKMVTTVISGVKKPTVIKILDERSKKLGMPLKLLGKDYSYEIENSQSFQGVRFYFNSLKDRLIENREVFSLALKGEFQAENATNAIATVRQLADYGFRVTNKDINQTLLTTKIPGRFELTPLSVSGSPLDLIMDGAHNPAKMHAFLHSLGKNYPNHRKIFVVAFKKGKDAADMIRQLCSVADEIIFTQFVSAMDWGRNMSMTLAEIKNQVAAVDHKEIKISYRLNVKKAFSFATQAAEKRQEANRPSIIIATGSLYLVGEVREYLNL